MTSPITTDAQQSKQLWRPEETFWQRYSPHHEIPVATVTAVTLCGFVLGGVVLIGLLTLGLSAGVDGPPGSDAVIVEPGGGPGLDGEGTGTTPLGKAKTELATSDGPSKPAAQRTVAPLEPLVKDLKADPLAVPVPSDSEATLDPSPFDKLEKDAKQADLEQQIQKERKAAQKAKAQAAKAGTGGPPGGGNGPGAGGGKGTGFGPGDGAGTGPNGAGRIGGRAPTIHEIHARRWQIFLSPDIDLHLRTLVAMRVTYLFQDNSGRLYQVQDLKRTPVEVKPVPPIDSKTVVAWQFEDKRILTGLAQKLGLRFWPAKGFITLPADVEQNLAAVEQEAIQKQGRGDMFIRRTHFDVRFKNGAYEPYVTGFE
jgi:hypothetical protein